MAGFALIFICLPTAIVILCILGATNNLGLISSLFRRWRIFLAIFVGFVILIFLGHLFGDKTDIEKSDIFGQYIIDRGMYKGSDADWQYNHYRFEIFKQGLFKFYVTDRKKVYKTYRGKVEFSRRFGYRIIIHPESKPDLIDTIPALYRKTFSFYYVMSGTPYGNMFYKKGVWKPIE